MIDAAAFFVYEIRDPGSSEIGAPLGSVRSASSLMVSHAGCLGEPDHTRQRK